MNRCIQCTRCVRFVTEVAGVPELGAIGRGEDMEITSYLESAMRSELQANVIDLCPVGALTSKPIAFHARPWEFAKTESVDVMDALGSAIRIDSRGREVVRILPRTNEAINEEWISDKTRYVADGLKIQRLDRPYVRVGGKLAPAAGARRSRRSRPRSRAPRRPRIGAIVGDLAAVEEMFALERPDRQARLAEHRLPPGRLEAASEVRPRRPISSIRPSQASTRRTPSSIIGSNPRREAPVLNARIRKRWLKGGVHDGPDRAARPT